MEFPFYVSKVLPASPDNITILDAASVNVKSNHLTNPSQGHYLNKSDSGKDCLAQIIDKMGEASSIAQGLGATITTYTKFISSGDNRLYIKTENNKVYGILKMGRRNLFYYDSYGRVKELRPLCVLDFYVHESAQRSGIGKALFEKMLEYERVEPSKLAYDRPSPKLISFLKKYYGLSKFIPQNNNYVIFDQYWEDASNTSNSSKSKGYQPYEDSRERKPYGNNYGSQRSFHNVGKSILENSHMSTTLARNDSSGYSKSEQNQPNSREGRDQYDYDLKRMSKNSIQYNPLDTRLKSNEDTYSQGKLQSYNPNNVKLSQPYQPKAPWGNFGNDDETYKSSSLAYGSHYGNGSMNYSRK